MLITGPMLKASQPLLLPLKCTDYVSFSDQVDLV